MSRERPHASTGRVASFLVPPLAVIVLLYQAFASLQIALTHLETGIVAGLTLAVAIAAGALAALGGRLVRVLVFSATTVLLIDATLHTPYMFEAMTPERRLPRARDAQRIADLRQIQQALDTYIREIGPLPLPQDYGEGTGPSNFWQGWWDSSAGDGDGNGLFFLDFLVSEGRLPAVPLDPMNVAPDPLDPRSGRQYVFYVVPPGYGYQGGACPAVQDKPVYMLAITDLETEETRPPVVAEGSGCECLWRDTPNFFQEYFDYVLCGSAP